MKSSWHLTPIALRYVLLSEIRAFHGPRAWGLDPTHSGFARVISKRLYLRYAFVVVCEKTGKSGPFGENLVVLIIYFWQFRLYGFHLKRNFNHEIVRSTKVRVMWGNFDQFIKKVRKHIFKCQKPCETLIVEAQRRLYCIKLFRSIIRSDKYCPVFEYKNYKVLL